MTHGSTAEKKVEREPSMEPEDETSPATSNRFRIQIDAFGRVIPKVIPANDDAKDK